MVCHVSSMTALSRLFLKCSLQTVTLERSPLPLLIPKSLLFSITEQPSSPSTFSSFPLTSLFKFDFCFGNWSNMSSVAEALLNFPDAIEKLIASSSPAYDNRGSRSATGIPVDILETPKEYIFYLDVPGLSKSHIQVTVEDENTLVISSNSKRKREEGEEEGCKYIMLERKPAVKLMRKFQLPENCNVSKISAKCENGVLTVVVEKLPPTPKSKTVQVTIS